MIDNTTDYILHAESTLNTNQFSFNNLARNILSGFNLDA